MRLHPPKDLEPKKLFELLIREPYPYIDHTLVFGGREFPCLVRAVSGAQEASFFDDGEDMPEEQRWENTCCRYLYNTVLDTKHRHLFPSEGWLYQNLQGFEARQLATQLLPKLRIISPTYATADVMLWQDVLKKGAQHNFLQALVLADAEPFYSYWGIKPNQVVDAQHIVWAACAKYVRQLRDAD